MKPSIPILLFILFLSINFTSAATLTVDKEIQETNNTTVYYSSIQDAINAAQEHDLILVRNGTYNENIVINKTVRVTSILYDDGDAASLEATNPDIPVISITAKNTQVSGLIITGHNDSSSKTGIFVDGADDCHISNNIITKTLNGISLSSSSKNDIVNNTILLNTEHGMYIISSNGNNILTNNIQNNKRGLYLENSDNNIIKNNLLFNNQFYGFALLDSSSNSIDNNTILSNKIGLALTTSNENQISNNNASQNTKHGLLLWNAESNIVTNNEFSGNEFSGMFLGSLSTDNNIENNLFLKNLKYGITIESADNNHINSNEFTQNNKYGIYHLYSGDENYINKNTFSDNSSENVKFTPIQQIAIVLIVLTIIALGAFFFKIAWLKKAFIVLMIIILLAIIATIVIYFPFEGGLSDYNVNIENIEKTIVPINDTYSEVTLSMDLNYHDRYSGSTEIDNEEYDILPVSVQISSDSPADGSYSSNDLNLENIGKTTLEYPQITPYECTFVIDNSKTYDIIIETKFKDELDYPHPRYKEIKWITVGETMTQINFV